MVIVTSLESIIQKWFIENKGVIIHRDKLGNVIRDIQTMLGKLDESNLSHDDSKRVIFQKDYRGYISEILLPKLLVITLITGYRPDLLRRKGSSKFF